MIGHDRGLVSFPPITVKLRVASHANAGSLKFHFGIRKSEVFEMTAQWVLQVCVVQNSAKMADYLYVYKIC